MPANIHSMVSTLKGNPSTWWETTSLFSRTQTVSGTRQSKFGMCERRKNQGEILPGIVGVTSPSHHQSENVIFGLFEWCQFWCQFVLGFRAICCILMQWAR